MSRSATLLISNAQIYTVAEEHPKATALAIRDGRILMVGRDEQLRRTYADAPAIDADGYTVVPGFIDAHAHLHELGRSLCHVDLTDTRSAADVVERLQAAVAERSRPSREWLRGHGWNETQWSSSQLPSRAHLDSAFPERPIWLIRADVHAGWANTAALERTVGLDRLRRMDDPEGGHIDRSADGEPTGILIDRAMALVEAGMPAPTDEQNSRALRTALEHTARHGITGVHDAGVTRNELRRFQHFINEDRFPLRVYAMLAGHGDALEHFYDRGPYHDDTGRLHVESVKYFADGALGSRGAALLDAYADDPGTRGWLLHDREVFTEKVRTAVAAGFQVNTHAIGDRANRFVLDAYETAMAECTAPVRRPRIEHAQVVAPEDVQRFGKLGVLASVQPIHATSDMEWIEARLGPERTDRAYAWNRLMDAGAPLAFGSDAPVEPIDPLKGFHAAVTRQDASGTPSGGWHPSQRLSRSATLHAYTKGAAYAAFQENDVGSLESGKRADFVVLSQDIMTAPINSILDTEVVATYVDGRPTYSSECWPDP